METYHLCLFSVPSCNDGVRNQDETDIDCGGDSCAKCEDSRICKIGSDCTSGVCTSNICQGRIRIVFYRVSEQKDLHALAPTCNDGTLNQDETDIDCGGDRCPKCVDHKICNAGQDCISGSCLANLCQGSAN